MDDPGEADIPQTVSPPYNPSSLVANTLVFIPLALVALLGLLRLPRALARFHRLSEWTSGHWLRHSHYTGPYVALSYAHSQSQEKFRTPAYPTVTYNEWATRDTSAWPPHVVPLPQFLSPIASLFHTRILPGFSLVQLSLYLIWVSLVGYAAIYRSSGPFTNTERFGYITISHIPFIVALANKNGLIVIFLGISYEKVNFLHRFIARVALVAAHLHAFGFFYKWAINDVFAENMSQKNNICGLGMLLTIDVMFLLSLAPIRKHAYQVFYYSHLIGFSVLLVFMINHNRETILPYFAVIVSLYAINKILSAAKTRYTEAIIRPLPELESTRIEIPALNAGWRAGQHVRLQIISSAMGVLGWTETHPFTIASASRTNEGIILICRKRGSWTKRLFAVACDAQVEAGLVKKVKVLVDGPYGGPGLKMFNSFSAALFIVGGSGISYALGAASELIQKGLKGQSRVQVIDVIWLVPDINSVKPLIPQFLTMLQQCPSLTISVHYTRSTAITPPKYLIDQISAQPWLALNPGRPGLVNAMEGLIGRATSGSPRSSVCGLLVGVCGPMSLADDVRKSVNIVDPGLRDKIGGIEVAEETFGL
ncbi:Ferric reductase transmembrane component 5 [Mycena kentingensis (nom. inval.)]|nr:Ferric reductase transmembrane component 5 [Mycena kentingensis (nom. inval.)]